MKLATFATRAEPLRHRVGVLTSGRMLDIGQCLQIAAPASRIALDSLKTLLALGADGLRLVSKTVGQATGENAQRFSDAVFNLEDITFLPPIPDADKFICVGKNYKTHLEELKRTGLIAELPTEPTGFVKVNSCLTGHDTDVVRPPSVSQFDYEPELVFVIGKRAFGVKAEDAFDYVAGITILNDLTCRETQKREVKSGSRFWTAKNAPGFGPVGPYVITMDEIKDPYDIWVSCSVNGQERMRVNTSEQIWRLPTILEHFSRLMSFEPGDMFSTGAPGGVAVGKANAEALFLKPGDVVECAFESPQMTLRNRIVAPH
jgi:2-keto-4-pentenoate hydratase/2-oxohepta-3-ene-1,7-dioic acid hydratase in catechol pathway